MKNSKVVNNNKRKKKTYLKEDFATPADHRKKIRKSEKKDKCLDLARKKQNNMKAMVIPLVIGAPGMVSKRLVRGLEELETGGRAENL